jgi:hypothetical protein
MAQKPVKPQREAESLPVSLAVELKLFLMLLISAKSYTYNGEAVWALDYEIVLRASTCVLRLH